MRNDTERTIEPGRLCYRSLVNECGPIGAEHEPSVYGWLGKGAESVPSILELAKLKRENKELLELVGELTLKLSAAQKKEVIGKHRGIGQQLLSTLGISRSASYYKPKQPVNDWALKQRIEEVLREHPSYGHRRIALELRMNKKKIIRCMRLFGMKKNFFGST
jgi:hypothetical protein